jgi:transcriptional regulator with XRE-family HTH domain
MVKTSDGQKIQDAHQALRQTLIERRTALMISQAELAALAKVSRPIISALEMGRGNPSLSTLSRLAQTLKCDIVALLPARRAERVGRNKRSTKKRPEPVRYSPAGRKPSLRAWLESPPLGSNTAAARDFGVDLTLLAQNLALTPEDRLQKMGAGAVSLAWLKKASPNKRR